MANLHGPGVLGELEADTLAALATETRQREPSSGIERILDADEVAAELMFDAPATAPPPPVRTGRPAPPPLAASPRTRPLTSPPPVRKRPPPTAAARLETAEAELTRLRTQMRARDAYLVELERALEASTSKLVASGIGSVEDAHKLLGRVRGQAFRIAELESELRNMEARLSRLARLLPAGYVA